MNAKTKILAAFAALILPLGAFAGTLEFALEDVRETKTEPRKFCESACVVLSETSDADAVRNAASALLALSPADLAAKVAKKKDAPRAFKYLKASKLSADAIEKSAVAKAGDFYLLVFEMPKGSRLKSGMNIMVFEKSGGGFLWNASFNDPLLALVATSDFAHPKAGDASTKAPTESDSKVVAQLNEKSLPYLKFANGALVSMGEAAGVNDTPEGIFYHKAQDVFYSWKLDEYGAFMTQPSRKKFESQFKNMPEAERKATLGEYFSWGKKYRKIMDAGETKLVLFSRHKQGATPYNDIAYLRKSPDGGLAIQRFGADKCALDLFLSKYVYPDDRSYLDEISKKFLKK